MQVNKGDFVAVAGRHGEQYGIVWQVDGEHLDVRTAPGSSLSTRVRNVTAVSPAGELVGKVTHRYDSGAREVSFGADWVRVGTDGKMLGGSYDLFAAAVTRTKFHGPATYGHTDYYSDRFAT